MAEVKFVDTSLANFSSKAELMLAGGVGNDVRQHSGFVITALRRSDADLFKSRNGYIGSSQNGFSMDRSIGALEKSERHGIEVGICITESLDEVVHAEEQLIGYPRREGGVENDGIVLYVEGSLLETKGEVWARGGETRAGAERSGLAALAHEPANREVMFIVKIMVNFG